MTIQQLQYVIAIADSGSINKASKELNVSQPALTVSVQELEGYVGIKIFNRSKRGISITLDGEEFLRYARMVCQQYELLDNKYYRGEKNTRRKFGVSTQHYSFAVKGFVEMVKKFDTSLYEFAIRETKTYEVLMDVVSLRSEIGIIYLSNFNRKVLEKVIKENELEFHELINCGVHVYLWKDHPLAKEDIITFEMLNDYPCISFEQGEKASLYFSEEFLSENMYSKIIKVCDRATVLNLMKGINGYTLCSGIICNELNGDDYIAVPFIDKEVTGDMCIGYVTNINVGLSDIGESYLEEIKRYIYR